MDTKKAFVAGLAAGVTMIAVSTVTGILIHGKMLSDLYAQTSSFWRPMVKTQPMTQFFICLHSSNLLTGIVMGFLYAWLMPAFGGSPAARGLKFGLLAFVFSALGLMGSSIVLDLPLPIFYGWALDHLIVLVIPGIVLGAVYGSGGRQPAMA